MLERIKALRIKHGYSQQEIAEMLGMKSSAYSKKECGRTRFFLSDAKKISDMFGESIDYIFFGK